MNIPFVRVKVEDTMGEDPRAHLDRFQKYVDQLMELGLERKYAAQVAAGLLERMLELYLDPSKRLYYSNADGTGVTELVPPEEIGVLITIKRALRDESGS